MAIIINKIEVFSESAIVFFYTNLKLCRILHVTSYPIIYSEIFNL